LCVRVSREEHEELRRAAARAGYGTKLAEYVRAVVFSAAGLPDPVGRARRPVGNPNFPAAADER
jgi:hypothetical protein